jgi:hypothetical protein
LDSIANASIKTRACDPATHSTSCITALVVARRQGPQDDCGHNVEHAATGIAGMFGYLGGVLFTLTVGRSQPTVFANAA